ncbi:MAG: hypothetical protein ACP5XB_07350, partial [Isosphaeraceae bacterium]
RPPINHRSHAPRPVRVVSGPEAGIQPLDIVTGITSSPASPVLGAAANFTLTTTPAPQFPIASTAWSFTITYGGVTSLDQNPNMSTNTTALVYLPLPGEYTVTAVTTYSSTNPSVAPPGPTTEVAYVNVSPPDHVAKWNIPGPAGYQTAEQVTDIVTSSGSQVGPYMGGLIQENIAHYDYYTGGIQLPGTGGWYPQTGGYTNTWRVTSGMLYDTEALVGQTQAGWNAIPVGTAFITYTQQLQYAWTMTAADGQHDFTVSLPSLNWSWVKVSTTQWQPQ